MKFIIVTDLAISCKLTVPQLLKNASKQIYSNITYFLMLNECVVWLIDHSLCGFNFYKDFILPQSWFHLIKEEKSPLTNESLQKLLAYKNEKGEKALSLSSIKRALFFLISKIASTTKLAPA